MHLKRNLARLTALAVLILAPLQSISLAADTTAAATSQSGSINGRVQNVVTGQYLNRVRISVKGTDQIAFTDEFGLYRLVGLRPGPAVLEVFYTGLDAQEIPITVSAGGNTEQNVSLTSAARYGQSTGVVKLDAFLVATNKETDADAIATNEQRFAPNIKNVVATDSLGDMVGASAGEFLKYLPGLAAEYDNAEVQGISIRGIGADLTTVEIDGAPSVTSGHGGATRAVNLIPQSINNLARVEVTKVPTPSSPADALAGSVNMISKTAFERSGAELRFGLNLTGNFDQLQLRATPHAYQDDYTHKILPGYDIDYTLPIGKNFGIVVTAMKSMTFNTQDINRRTWNAAGTGTGATFSNPYLQQQSLQSSPRERGRAFYGFKADWRVTPNSVLTIGSRLTQTTSARTGTTVLTPSAGTVAAPTPVTGTPFSFGPDFTIGATGRGALPLSGSRQLGLIDGLVSDIHYRFDDGKWKITSAMNYGWSESKLNPGANGPFTGINAVANDPVRVSFTSIPVSPASLHVYDNNNREIDIYDINNYRMTTATRNIRNNVAISRFARLDVGRRLDWFPFPTTVQIGGLYRNQDRDRRETTENWTFSGAVHPAKPYLNKVYVNQPTVLGFKNLPGISSVGAYRMYLADQSIATKTLAQQVAEVNAQLNTSEYAAEAVTSYYGQVEARLFNNKLSILTGVRHEQTDVTGEGVRVDNNAVFVRNADGTFARTAAGVRIRKPQAGAVGSLEEARLIRTERGYTAERTYGGFYPSLHVTYNIKEDFIARVAYARTYGRPDFVDIIPTATITEADLDGEALNDPKVIKGNITVRNTGLKPWTADNYDFSAEYYTPQGGVFSAGVFRKDIANFFGTEVRVATLADLELVGLDPSYVGWNLNTKFNSGSARITGFEFNARQPLRQLGGIGNYFTVFANATKLKLEGNALASFASFVPKTANWGFSFNYKRFSFVPKMNYRGLNKLIAQPLFGPDGFQYIKPRIITDLSMAYRLTSRLSLTASAGNIFNRHLTQMHYSSLTPQYARQSLDSVYGVSFAIGVRGNF